MKKLLKQLKKNWHKYLLEILVIAAGILLAFGLNTWKENNKVESEQLNILIELKAEYEQNQLLLEEAIVNHESILAQSQELSHIIGKESVITDLEKFNALANTMIWPPRYDPSDGVLNAVISSGNFSLIESNQLKISISTLSNLLKLYEYWVEIDLKNIYVILPTMTQTYSLRNFPFHELGRSKFESSPAELSRNLEFESIVVLRWVVSNSLIRTADDIYEEQDKLVKLIGKEIARLEN